ncbi:MAG: hypothetical protein ACYC91_16515 [Solirubrobacteraceae bacterium]
MTALAGQLVLWPARRWLAAAVIGSLAGLAMGVPTGVIRTSFYTRMTPVTWWDYPIWVISAAALGLLAATYLRLGRPGSSGGARAISGGVLTTLAIGCPICNKLVVALLGVSGALNYWAPLQPLLGLASVALLLATLTIRLRGERSCTLTRLTAR